LLSWIAHFIVAFFVAVLPERYCTKPPYDRFQHRAAHFLSGIVECVLGLGLFALTYMGTIGGVQAADGGRTRGIAFLGAVSAFFDLRIYLFFGMFVEGLLRAMAALLSEHRHGIALIWILDKIALRTQKKTEEENIRSLIGPPRPDRARIKMPEGMLEIFSTESKPWADRQFAEYGESIYVLKSKDFVKAGTNHRYRYIFRPLDRGEIIRGSVVNIPKISTDPPAPPFEPGS
jgi:hypothetical protein